MIDKNIYIEDLVREYPEVISPLADLGIICIACGEPVWGTLEELVDKKGLHNLDQILEKLNKIINIKNYDTE
jgi:methionine synthase II (cobalamin-independent)